MNNEAPSLISLGERYEVLGEIGRGGMGVVYKARDKVIDQVVAIKAIKISRENESYISRLKREARTLSSLNHSNIVKVIRLETVNGFLLLVMEYLDGSDLAGVIENEGALRPNQCRILFVQALSALKALHDQKVVHRDIKPSNLMLITDADGQQLLKVLDFGIAKQHKDTDDQRLTKTGAILGTSTYMSPEQCRGETLDPRSDLYSLGCVLYCAATGKPPFGGESDLQLMWKHLHEDAEAMGEATTEDAKESQHLNAVYQQAVRKDPTERFQTAEEFAAALQNLEFKSTNVAKDKRPQKRLARPTVLVLVGILIVLIGAMYCYQWISEQQNPWTAATSSNREECHRLLREAKALYDTKGTSREIQSLSEQGLDIVSRDPSKFREEGMWLHQLLGDLYGREERIADAIAEYRKAVEFSGGDFDLGNLPIRLAELYRKAEKQAAVVELYRGMLDDYPRRISEPRFSRIKIELALIPNGARSANERYQLLTEGLENHAELSKSSPDLVASGFGTLGQMQIERKEFAAAARTYRQSLPYVDPKVRHNRIEILIHKYFIIVSQIRAGIKPDLAMTSAIFREYKSENENDTPILEHLGALHNELAGFYDARKEYKNASVQFKEALFCYQKRPPKESLLHLRVAYATSLRNAGFREQAAEIFEQCVGDAQKIKVLKATDISPEWLEFSAGIIFDELGNKKQALRAMEKTRLLSAARGDKVYDVLALSWIAHDLLRQKKYTQAKTALEAVRTRSRDIEHLYMDTTLALANLADIQAEFKQAKALYENCLAFAKEKQLARYQMLAMSGLSETLDHTNDFVSSQAVLHQLVATGKANQLTGLPQYMGANWRIALYNDSLKNYPLVISATGESMKTMQLLFGKDSLRLAEMLNLRARAYSEMSKYELAEADYKRALQIASLHDAQFEGTFVGYRALLKKKKKDLPTLKKIEAQLSAYRAAHN